MKKAVITVIILVAAAIIAGGIVFFLCARKNPDNGPKTNPPDKPAVKYGPLDFQSLTIKESNMSAVLDVLSAERTENGVRLVRAYENMSNDEVTVIREINGDEKLLDEVRATFGEYGVEGWDGFRGENPPDILDGTSMSFECTMADGRHIEAYGSNNFPDNYGAVYRYLFDMLYSETVSSTEFEGRCFKLTLPESWVGNVTVTYQEDYNAFIIPVGERDVRLMRVDFRTYDLNMTDGVTNIGKIRKVDAGEYDMDMTLSVLDFDDRMREDEGTAEQYEIYESFKDDLKSIIESIELADGYEFVPEEE